MFSSEPDVPQTVTVRFWAGARAAAGVAETEVSVRSGATVADVRREVVSALPDSADLPRVLGICSALVGDRPVGAGDAGTVEVPAGVTVEFLPPFAGG